ncbi:CPCC family cysteine-rich protein [uncultured Paraglaciecola sp.]|uniref:CPCC family cysteine-rich protein n=1 Tax=uncultured Paraglaciecola sp. TaxID=1765024 RepID=UPI00261DF8B9|nr:CPCC family cysteine-rich protein [uncultured Paraglaciecola sp.]
MNDTKKLVACPCCNYLTLPQLGMYEICEVCFWEDDGAQNPDDYSKPNHIFLRQEQDNFLTIGACDELGACYVTKQAKLQ